MTYRNLVRGMTPLAGLVALSMSGTAAAGACLVVEDGTMPTDSSTYGGGAVATTQDITALKMETVDDKLVTTIDLVSTATHPSGSYIVYWTDSNGGQFYTQAYIAADGTQEFTYGSWAQGAASIESSEIGPTNGTVTGTSISVEVKIVGIGFPSSLNAYAVSGTGIRTPIGSASGFSDRTDEGVYSIGDTCEKAAETFKVEGACLIAEDSGSDSFNPTFDIVSLSAATVDGTLTSVVELSTPPDAAVGSSLRVIYKDQRYMEADLSIPQDPLFEYGSYTNNGDNTVTFSPEGEATGSLNGSTVAISVPVDAFGLQGLMNVRAETAAPFITGLDSVEGAYSIGDSCAKAADYYGANYEANQALKSADSSSSQQMAAAGSFGWLMILAGLIGLRRSR